MIWVVVLFAMALLAGAYFNNVEIRQKNTVRRMYVDLVRDKLDLLRTALTLGFSDQALADLNQRLEKLIGTEKMLQTLQSEKEASAVSAAGSALLDTDLEAEIERVRRAPGQHKQ